MIAAAPRSPVPVPVQVRLLAGGRPVRAVWGNQLGGITFEIGGPGPRRFVKWSPAGCGIDLGREAARLGWASTFTPVPKVVLTGSDLSGSWLMTAGLTGDSAVAPRWRAAPAVAVAAVGEGLRALHDALPVGACPFTWSVEGRLADIGHRVAAGRLDPAGWHREHRHLTVAEAVEGAARPPSVDRLVVCHGDSCAPNTLLTSDGRWSGHVDLGGLGVADRWADLAVATWSIEWNFGPGWQDRLLDAYGIGPDPERTRYYRLLWDLGP